MFNSDNISKTQETNDKMYHLYTSYGELVENPEHEPGFASLISSRSKHKSPRAEQLRTIEHTSNIKRPYSPVFNTPSSSHQTKTHYKPQKSLNSHNNDMKVTIGLGRGGANTNMNRPGLCLLNMICTQLLPFYPKVEKGKISSEINSMKQEKVIQLLVPTIKEIACFKTANGGKVSDTRIEMRLKQTFRDARGGRRMYDPTMDQKAKDVFYHVSSQLRSPTRPYNGASR